ncbi:Rv3235 family protein [Streptomyces sp. NPDC005017]|uniref:Rv3235 family protein n=1 Tax=Streptomyces sp. NPDC005017 TaxID=3364706 RepID=UPI003681D7E7
MDKVMTRTNREHLAPRSAAAALPAHAPARPGTRPPTRRDPRRPGGPAPRAGTAPTVRPPGSPGTLVPAPGAPSTARPPGTRPTAPGSPSRALPGPLSPEPPTPTVGREATRGAGTAPPARPTPRPTAVPAQATPHRPVPQPRPTDLFADRLLLVLSGQRPVHWMLRHTAGQAYDDLTRLAERGSLRTRGTRPVVRDIGYYVPRDGAVEAFARIAAGDQLRAMAFRLELGRDRRWRCTAVELGRTAGASGAPADAL